MAFEGLADKLQETFKKLRGKGKLSEKDIKEAMREVLRDIQEGTFAKNWLLENKCGRPYFNAKRRIESEQQLEKVGAELRKMMTWAD